MRTLRIGLAAVLATLVSVAPALAACPDGLYLMTKMDLGFGTLEVKGWYFKNGKLTNRPQGDLNGFVGTPDSVGSYSVAGNKMSIKWNNGRTESGTFELKDHGCFYYDMGLFCPAKPFTTSTIDGTFTGGISAGGGAAANSITVTFTSAGKYTMKRAGSVRSTGRETSAWAGAYGGDESGSYSLSGTTLNLSHSGGGAARKIVAFPYDDGSKGPQPRNIVYEGMVLKRI